MTTEAALNFLRNITIKDSRRYSKLVRTNNGGHGLTMEEAVATIIREKREALR